MKKIFTLFLVFTFLGMGPVFFNFANAEEVEIPAGTVIRGPDNATLYYLAEDGKRYVFPNSKTYFSWYEDFESVVEIETLNLTSYSLGGNVNYRPGALLVKIETDPKVYAVAANGKLRWVKSEAVARGLYGSNWNKLIDDIPDAFFTNYKVGEPIDEESGGYDPIRLEEENKTISQNKGFVIRNVVKNRIRSLNETRCERIEKAINKLQRRADSWGVNIPGLADEFVQVCDGNMFYERAERLNQMKRLEEDNVVVCRHAEEEDSWLTIVINKKDVQRCLDNGNYLGECGDKEIVGE